MNSTDCSKIRKPVAAGKFYPAVSAQIKLEIEGFVKGAVQKTKCIGCVLPHAGYAYSGSVAAQTLAAIDIPDTVVLLGPNHTGEGVPFSIMAEGIWQTPMGENRINAALAKEILKKSSRLQEDMLAHTNEHSLEVELPILQYFRTAFDIVPIVVYSQDLKELKLLGTSIADAIISLDKKNSVLIVASSDMTHYEPKASAEKKDKLAIEAITKLDEDRLMQVVSEFDISMCGYMPVIVMLCAAKQLGAKKAKLIKYQTSGDVSGDKSSVVGYAGIIIQ